MGKQLKTEETGLLTLPTPDIVLAQRTAQGDEQAFNLIFNRYCRTILLLCWWMVGNRADAQDVSQEAWFNAFRKMGEYRGDSKLATWLHRIAVNKALEHLRKPSLRYQYIGLDGLTERELGVESSIILCLTLDQALNQLPYRNRTVILLHHDQGYEYREVAAMQECGWRTSKKLGWQSRIQLRKILDGDVPTPPAAKPTRVEMFRQKLARAKL